MSFVEYQPEQYHRWPENRAVQDALEDEIGAAADSWNDFVMQLDVSTATWGLDLWERAIGIATDLSRPLDYRRTRVLSKLRGSGTVTKEHLKNVAESFVNGQVDVLENSDELSFTIQFISEFGIPPNLDDLTAAIEELKPAHLAYRYIYRYCTWAMVETSLWNNLGEWTWDEVLHGAAVQQ